MPGRQVDAVDLERHLVVGIPDPGPQVLVERLEALQVENARSQGWTWEQIAQLLGVTRQAVHKKYASGRGPLRRRD